MHDKPSLLAELTHTHDRICQLINSLTEAELAIPFNPGVNPPIWEIGHSAYFFEVFILQALDQATSFSPELDEIWDSFQIHHKDRWEPGVIPTREWTLNYVNTIHQRIYQRISEHELSPEHLYLYKYAIFHQNMHIESLVWARQTVAYPPPLLIA
jgi:iron(II)-dependent oxidoreductase